MKTLITLIFASLILNFANASDQCSSLLITEKSQLQISYKNSRHDYFGSNDEILVELTSSLHQLDESKMFSDLMGSVTYKQGPTNRIGIFKEVVPFYGRKKVVNVTVKHELLYAHHLNLLVVDQDVNVPIASGSIEVPIFILSGGNHDDLIFANSLKLNLSVQAKEEISIRNSLGDEITVTVSPAVVKKVTRDSLEQSTNQLISRENSITDELSQDDLNMVQYLSLEKELREIRSRIEYQQDLLDGKVLHSCDK